jgi:hypothetical protein
VLCSNCGKAIPRGTGTKNRNNLARSNLEDYLDRNKENNLCSNCASKKEKWDIVYFFVILFSFFAVCFLLVFLLPCLGVGKK